MTMAREEHDIVVVGAGTSGTFAGGTAADKGLDVVILERKDEEEAGHIACGDAIHSPSNENDEEFPGPFDMDEVAEQAGVDGNIERGLYWDEELGVEKEVEFSDSGNVVDRHEWGRALIEQAEKQGAEIHYDTIVNDVVQDEQVEGVKAVRDGEPVQYDADLVIDAGGALSFLQDKVDFKGMDSTFEKPRFSQFASAYREIVETEEDVPYDDALVVKPLSDTGMGYLWYFPRTPREINAGLGFQMSEEPLDLVDILKDDLEGRPEYEGAEVKDKLGAALGLRRPLDSAVAPGYIAVGDAAGMVSPTTGKGITGAAISGWSAGEHGAEAVSDGDVSEEALWDHNHYIFSEHGEGAKLAKQDVYNIAGSAYDVDELRGAVALIPVDTLMHGISGDSQSYGFSDVMDVLSGIGRENYRHWRDGSFEKLDISQRRANEVIKELYGVFGSAEDLKQHYLEYPDEREDFEDWQEERDILDQEIVDAVGADPKY